MWLLVLEDNALYEYKSKLEWGKNHVLQFEKMYFLYCSFLAAPLALHFKDDL
jgi:hypothetical protein